MQCLRLGAHTASKRPHDAPQQRPAHQHAGGSSSISSSTLVVRVAQPAAAGHPSPDVGLQQELLREVLLSQAPRAQEQQQATAHGELRPPHAAAYNGNGSNGSSNGSRNGNGLHAAVHEDDDAAAAAFHDHHHEQLQQQQQQVGPHMAALLQQQEALHAQQAAAVAAAQQHQQHQQQQQLLAAPQRSSHHVGGSKHLNERALRTAQFYREQANRRLTARIRDVDDLGQLRGLLRQYEGALNHVHASALLCRLAKLVSMRALRPRDMLALPSTLSPILALVEAALPDFDERCISNCLHSLAVLELGGERRLIAALLAAAEGVRLARFTPQGLSVTAWALGSMRVDPGQRFLNELTAAAAAVLPRLEGQGLAQLGWALAVLQARVDEGWLAQWRDTVLRALRLRGGLTPQGLSMVLWASARLDAAGGGASSSSSAFSSPAAAAALSASSSSSSQQQHSQWLDVVESVFRAQLPRHSPHSISTCLWALGRLGHRPCASLLDAAIVAVQPQLETAASATTLAVLLYSLAALGYCPPPAFMAAHGAALRRRVKRLSVRELANVLWAHAKLGLPPSGEGLTAVLLEALQYGMQDANARDLSSSLWALATLGVRPRPQFLGTFGAQAEAVVHDFTPQEVSALLWAYAKLGARPPHMLLVALWEGVGVDAIHTASSGSSSSGQAPAGMQQLGLNGASGSGAADSSSSSGGYGGYSARAGGGSEGSEGSSASARLSAFKPAELSMLVWALAKLKLAPGKAWWDQFLQASFHKLGAQSPQGLANLIWSLSELRLAAPPAWLYAWAAAARGQLPAMNPIDLGQVAAALQGPTFGGLQLPKLEALLSEVHASLAALESHQDGPAYSHAAVGKLLRMQHQQHQQQQQQASLAAAAAAAVAAAPEDAGSSSGNGSVNGDGSSESSVPHLKALLATASSSLDD